LNQPTSSKIAAAAAALCNARDGRLKVDVAGHPWAPASEADAYAVQTAVAETAGPVGGWKVGAPSPRGHASFAPLPVSGFVPSGTTLADGVHRMRGIEVEIAFRLSRDLPQRESEYSREEVLGAIDAVLPVIEVVETRLSDRSAANGLWALADSVSHGELVLGKAIESWQGLNLDEVHVTLQFAGKTIVDRACRNAGDRPSDMVVRLANICNDHCGGLKAGQIVTTGSLMGLEVAGFQNDVVANTQGLGGVTVSFG
jgi:2-keto-4-pentenoate hydratase